MTERTCVRQQFWQSGRLGTILKARLAVEGIVPGRLRAELIDPGKQTTHQVYVGDARQLSFIPDESVHLVVTSPPYGGLKEYPPSQGQLGNLDSYDEFLAEMDKVLSEWQRILVPGGRVCAVIGDICLSRRRAGRHRILPLPSDIQVRARSHGLDALTPIMWLKVANITLEASRSSRFLGKPYLPGGVVKNDRETIVLLRKPGGYRKPTSDMETRSKIAKEDYFAWFRPMWTDVTGASTKHHPAPYPLEIPRRLIQMYSFVGDIVVDPFGGTGTTAEAAFLCGRNSISVDVQDAYVTSSVSRLQRLLPIPPPPPGAVGAMQGSILGLAAT
ncbi:MAG: methyltransferase [Anaerolinea sp.]|nr:methyltransferase [Anaerolinea sp.]